MKGTLERTSTQGRQEGLTCRDPLLDQLGEALRADSAVSSFRIRTRSAQRFDSAPSHRRLKKREKEDEENIGFPILLKTYTLKPTTYQRRILTISSDTNGLKAVLPGICRESAGNLPGICPKTAGERWSRSGKKSREIAASDWS